MKLNYEAVNEMMNEYRERIMYTWEDVYNGRSPMRLVQECKKIHEEICWAEEGGWLGSRAAEAIWNRIEEICKNLLEE